MIVFRLQYMLFLCMLIKFKILHAYELECNCSETFQLYIWIFWKWRIFDFWKKKKLTKVRLKCNYLNYANSYYKFLNKIWHCFNWRKNLCPVTSIKNIMLYPLLTDKNYHDDNLNESCLPLTPSKNLSYLFN